MIGEIPPAEKIQCPKYISSLIDCLNKYLTLMVGRYAMKRYMIKRVGRGKEVEFCRYPIFPPDMELPAGHDCWTFSPDIPIPECTPKHDPKSILSR